MKNNTAKMVVYINSDSMGSGDEELGHLLMKNFLATLADFIPDISHITLVNSGVKLACQGSSTLAALKMLEEAGVTILSCKTCLTHFNLEESLGAGSVSNMFSILDAVSRSSKILTP